MTGREISSCMLLSLAHAPLLKASLELGVPHANCPTLVTPGNASNGQLHEGEDLQPRAGAPTLQSCGRRAMVATPAWTLHHAVPAPTQRC